MLYTDNYWKMLRESGGKLSHPLYFRNVGMTRIPYLAVCDWKEHIRSMHKCKVIYISSTLSAGPEEAGELASGLHSFF